ncbi:APC family permease [Pseudomarimonas arenosa]|uniref:Arginine/agmatine antiporter n=1 Tax=Pseudomarimonas arenosa TaxID=2774145 RepID=A0AAW3ZJY6_9GAMM|nr:amino acid permease [Pseudomarimonas arenosa]MBD8525829.1 amino acid permease [Pseudomarimonas arenosa]
MTEHTGGSQETSEGLVRRIGTGALGANIVNLVVGAGIFTLPGIVAAQLGPAAILAYLACAVTVSMVFLCYAEVGSRISRSGGSYTYIAEAFGPFAGFVASTLFWLGWSVLADAALAIALTDALALVIPALAEGAPRNLFLIALFGFLAMVNIAGLKSGVRLVLLTTIAKLLPLLLLTGVGLFAMRLDQLHIDTWPTLQDFGASVLILFFAFAGAETALNTSGEIKDPARTVPRGLLLGVGGVFILYVLLQGVSQGALGADLAGNTEAPLSAVANHVLGDWGGQLLLLAMIVSIFGALSGDVLNTPRLIFASARDGLLPGVLAKVHPRHRTPHVAIAFFAAAGCVFALTGSFKLLAVVASGAILLIYLGVALAVIALRRRHGPPEPGQFRIPGGPLVPMLSAAVIIWLLLQMSAQEAIGAGLLLAVTVLMYVIRGLLRRG